MKNLLKKLGLIMGTGALIAFGFLMAVTTPSAKAQTVNFWTQNALNSLVTNTSGGLANADIHVKHCYIGLGTGTPCSGGGGGTIAGTIAANQVAFGSALDTIAGSNNLTYTTGTGIFQVSGASGQIALVDPASDRIILGYNGILNNTNWVLSDSSKLIQGRVNLGGTRVGLQTLGAFSIPNFGVTVNGSANILNNVTTGHMFVSGVSDGLTPYPESAFLGYFPDANGSALAQVRDVGGEPSFNEVSTSLSGQYSMNVSPTGVFFNGTNGTSFGINDLTQTLSMSRALDMTTHFIHNVLDPASAQDAATKSYVDSFSIGLSWKTVVTSATTAPLSANVYSNGAAGVGRTLTAVLPGALVIDGYSPVLNDRVLIKDEATPSHNGIYTLTTVGTGGVAYILTGATDADTSSEQTLAATAIINGSINANTAYTQVTPQPITMGTTALVWNMFLNNTYTAGAGITLTGHSFSLNTSHANDWLAVQTFESGMFKLAGATSGFLTENTAPVTASYTITHPGAQGGSNTFERNDGAGNMTWQKVQLATDVVGTLPVANGGTSLTTLTAHNLLIGNAASAPLFLAPSTSGKIVGSNGTDFIMSTPTFPISASATARKMMVSDGTNWLASTETWAVPGTSGNVLTSNGTNWTSAAPAAPSSYTGLIENISFEDSTNGIAAQTYTLELFASYGYTINVLHIKSLSGTGTAAVQINGVNVTGCSAVAVTGVISNNNCSAANTVVAGDKITLVITVPAALNDLTVSLKTTRT